MNNSRAEIIAKWKAFAEANYNKGYDTFVECYDAAEWDRFYDDHAGEVDVYAAGLELMARLADVWEDRRADARNSAF